MNIPQNSRVLIIALLLVSIRAGAQIPTYVPAERQADSLLTLANELQAKKNYTGMLESAQLAGQIIISSSGKNSERYANCLLTQGKALGAMNRYQDAEPFYVEAVDILANVPAKDSLAYYKAQHTLASAYHFMGRRDKAEFLFIEARAGMAQKAGTQSPDYLAVTNSLGRFYSDNGRQEQALPYFLEVKSAMEQNGQQESANYAGLLINLGLLHSALYRFDETEAYYVDAKSILERHGATRERIYLNLLNNFGGLYHQIGQYGRAEEYYVNCINARAEINGVSHPAYGVALMNLGILYNDQGRYSDAEPYLLEASEIFATTLSKEGLHYATILINLADLYRNMGQYAKAEPMYTEAMGLWEKLTGKESNDYIIALSGLAWLHLRESKFEAAETEYTEALRLAEELYGKNNPEYVRIASQKAELYRLTNRKEQARQLYLETNAALNFNLSFNAILQSGAQMESFLKRATPGSNELTSLFHDDPDPELGLACLNRALFVGGTLSRSNFVLLKAMNSDPATLRSRYDEWLSLKRQIGNELIKPLSEQAHVDSLAKEADRLENELIRLSPVFTEYRRPNDWITVQHGLKKGEVAVQFVSYQYFRQFLTDSILYGAWIIYPKGKEPEYIPLFEEKAVIKANPDEYYRLIWAQLEPKVAGYKMVYAAPTGLIYAISLGDLKDANGKKLSTLHNLRIVGSTARIRPAEGLKGSEVLYGQIESQKKETTAVNALVLQRKKEQFWPTIPDSVHLLQPYEIERLDLQGHQMAILYLPQQGTRAEKGWAFATIYTSLQRAGVRYVLVGPGKMSHSASDPFLMAFLDMCAKGMNVPDAYAKAVRKTGKNAASASPSAWVLFE